MINSIFGFFFEFEELWSIQVKMCIFGSMDLEFIKEIRIVGKIGG